MCVQALWVIEKQEVSEGGQCIVSKAGVPCSYRFRHMGTGRFLAASLGAPTISEDGKETQNFDFHVTDTTRQKDSLFHFDASGGSSNLMLVNAKVLLKHSVSSRYLHAEEAGPDEMDSYPGAISSRSILGVKAIDEHTIQLEEADPKEVSPRALAVTIHSHILTVTFCVF